MALPHGYGNNYQGTVVLDESGVLVQLQLADLLGFADESGNPARLKIDDFLDELKDTIEIALAGATFSGASSFMDESGYSVLVEAADLTSFADESGYPVRIEASDITPFMDMSGNPIRIVPRYLMPFVDSSGDPVYVEVKDITSFADESGEPIRIDPADISSFQDESGNPIRISVSGVTSFIDGSGIPIKIQASDITSFQDMMGNPIRLLLSDIAPFVDESGDMTKLRASDITSFTDDDGTPTRAKINMIAPTTTGGTWHQNLITVIENAESGSVEVVSSGREIVIYAADADYVYTIGASGDITYPSGVPISDGGFNFIPSCNVSGWFNYAVSTGSGTIWVWENE